MPLHLKLEEQEEKALEITRQALGSQPEVIQTISENYIELGRAEGQGLHFDYLTLYELPMFKRFQQFLDTAKTPQDLLDKVRNLVDMNEEPSSALYHAGQAFLEDVDALRDKILKVSQARMDGSDRAITARSFRQLLKWGVEEMNKVGPLSNVYLWEKIAIDACRKQLQDKIDELEAHIKEVATRQTGNLVDAISGATQELDDFFEGLNLQVNGKALDACQQMKASTWALAPETAFLGMPGPPALSLNPALSPDKIMELRVHVLMKGGGFTAPAWWAHKATSLQAPCGASMCRLSVS